MSLLQFYRFWKKTSRSEKMDSLLPPAIVIARMSAFSQADFPGPNSHRATWQEPGDVSTCSVTLQDTNPKLRKIPIFYIA